MMRQCGRVFVLSAPSGTGKSTLIARSCEEIPGVRHSISATTRPKRDYEEDGVHYRFMERADFHEMTANDEFLEWARVFDEYYGTPRSEVEARLSGGEDVIMDLDVRGALQVRERRADAILVFLMPPSLEELGDRLRRRATESEEKIEARLSRAEEEMAQSRHYDHVIVNDDIEAAFQAFKELILARREEENLR